MFVYFMFSVGQHIDYINSKQNKKKKRICISFSLMIDCDSALRNGDTDVLTWQQDTTGKQIVFYVTVLYKGYVVFT